MSGPGPVRYRFGGPGRSTLLLGLGMRQSVPLVAGCCWLTLGLMAQHPWIALAGPLVGVLVSFGRWRQVPLYDVAGPVLRSWWRRRRGAGTWTQCSLLAEGEAGPVGDGTLPGVLAGIELLDVAAVWAGAPHRVGVVHDRVVGTVSVVLPVDGSGFAVSAPTEQDGFVSAWAGVLAPFARERCPVVRLTWQLWRAPGGLDGHRRFLAGCAGAGSKGAAVSDYEELLQAHAPLTTSHEVLVTVTVDLRRVPGGGRDALRVAMDVVVEEARLLAARLDSAGLRTAGPSTALELTAAVRGRSAPARRVEVEGLRRSLAAAAGKGPLAWGPMATRPEWAQVWVDGAVHRTFVVAAWPMLPVPADWLAPLLSVPEATMTVTVVLEPVPLRSAAAAANRELTALEADQGQKHRHGFRLTARERRRHRDVEAREEELAAGHPEFRHAAFVTVTAGSVAELDEVSGQVEQAAAQSLLDLRLLAARQAEGWVCALPLGRNARRGVWS